MKNNYTKEQAIQYSEGNEILKEILFLCLEKDIETIGCCAGHYCMTWEKRKEYLQEYYNMNYCGTIVDTEEKWLQVGERHYNECPYIAFGKEECYNLIAHILSYGCKDDYSYSIVYNDQYKWGVLIEFDSIDTEKDEIKFKEKVDEFFMFLLSALKSFDKEKQYDCKELRLLRDLRKKYENLNILISGNLSKIDYYKTNQPIELSGEYKVVDEKFLGFKKLYYDPNKFFYDEECLDLRKISEKGANNEK